MWKIGGGFWPFLAGKRAGSDSEVLATLISIKIEESFIMSFQEMERNTSTTFNGQNELTLSDLNESENPNDDVDISVGSARSAFTSKVEGIYCFY